MTLPIQDSIFDPRHMADLKRMSGEKSPEALKAVAQQFEALFVQMMLKQMRQAASMGGGSEGEQVGFYRGLADQQLAVNLSKTGGIGLARSIERQLARTLGAGTDSPDAAEGGVTDPSQSAARQLDAVSALPQRRVLPAASAATTPAATTAADGAGGFIDRIWKHALGAAQSLGVPAQFVVGQAALESGWGRGELKRADGQTSFNLFNIKAGSDWKGAVVEASTTEYVGGVPQRRTERFRAYGSYEEAFQDYARLIETSPRYAAVRGQTSAEGFAQALSKAGYATDPMYAQKLSRIIGGTTLRSALAG